MRETTEQLYRRRVLRVLIHIQNHLDEPLQLDDLARLAHFSPCHFHRIFRGMVGESLMEHVRRLRLERAAYRLKLTDQPIVRVALDAGYESHEAFSRAFRTMFGDSPSQFRESSRTPSMDEVPSCVHFSPDGPPDDFQPYHSGGVRMDVRVEQVDPMTVVFVRHVGPYEQVGATWEKLCAWAGPRGFLGGNMKMLGLSHDDPEVTPPEKLRYDACVAVDRPVEPEGEVGVQVIGGGRYAIVTHKGPYERLAETYAYLCGTWMPGSGHELGEGPAIENYLNSPQHTAPEELLTDIYMPLAEK